MFPAVRGTAPPYTPSALGPVKYGALFKTVTQVSNVLSALNHNAPVDGSRNPSRPKIWPNSCRKTLSASVLFTGTGSIFAGFGSNHSSFVRYEVPMWIAASYGPQGLCTPFKTVPTVPC